MDHSNEPHRVRSIFAIVSTHPLSEQQAILERECGPNLQLRAEVEQLLFADAQFSSQLLHFDSEMLQRQLPQLAGLPDRVGNFTFRERIGSGGFSDVFLAEQTNPHRQVAFKVLRTSAMDAGAHALEGALLARLQHEGITTVYETGALHADQVERPFIAMELISGAPLTVHADAARLDLRDRIRLFIRVCDAVRHAHHRGVLHLDLKPANILVHPPEKGDSIGRPRVLDFGISIFATGESHNSRVRGDRIYGTPAYMSPEQATCGAEVDVRADVYALGATLCEILGGAPPLRLTGRDREALLKQVRDAERPLMSKRFCDQGPRREEIAGNRRLPIQGLQRGLSGDLDAIVRKATSRDREDRFSGVDALRAELQRYLHHEPLSIRAPDLRYVAGKWIARHTGLAVSLAVLGIISIAFMVGITALYFAQVRATARAENGERSAQRRYADARGIALFVLEDLNRQLALLPGAEQTQRRLVAKAFDLLCSLADEMPNEPLALADFAEAQAQLGQVALSLERPDEAKSRLENAWRLRGQLLAKDPTNLLLRRRYAADHVRLGALAERRGLADEALFHFSAAYTIQSEIAAQYPDDLEVQGDHSWAYERLGYMYEARNDPRGHDFMRARYAHSKALLPLAPNDTERLRDWYFANLYFIRTIPDGPDQRPFIDEAVAINQQLLAIEPNHLDFLRECVFANIVAIDHYLKSGDYLNADRAATRAKVAMQHLSLTDMQSPVTVGHLQNACTSFANIAITTNAWQAAAYWLDQRMELMRILEDLDPANPTWPRLIGSVLEHRARITAECDLPGDWRAMKRGSLEARRFAAGHPNAGPEDVEWWNVNATSWQCDYP